MIKFDYSRKENIKEDDPNWHQSPGHPYRLLIIGRSSRLEVFCKKRCF